MKIDIANKKKDSMLITKKNVSQFLWHQIFCLFVVIIIVMSKRMWNYVQSSYFCLHKENTPLTTEFESQLSKLDLEDILKARETEESSE